MSRFPVLRDIVERVASTFGAAVLGAWVSDGLNWQNYFHADTIKTYVAAGVVAVITLLKGMAATWVARRNGQATSASLDPAVKLQPVGGAVDGSVL
jgi:hypothetical protein